MLHKPVLPAGNLMRSDQTKKGFNLVCFLDFHHQQINRLNAIASQHKEYEGRLIPD